MSEKIHRHTQPIQIYCSHCYEEIPHGEQYRVNNNQERRHLNDCEKPKRPLHLTWVADPDAALDYSEWTAKNAGDPLLPAQFTPAKPWTGERALLQAVLEEALQSVRNTKNVPNCIRRQREAADWFVSQSTEPFSFIWICHHLNIDPDLIRSKLKPTIEKAIEEYDQLSQHARSWPLYHAHPNGN